MNGTPATWQRDSDAAAIRHKLIVTPASAVLGTDEDWDKECRDCIDAMAAGGGFMLATGCEYPANASFDRARRMIDIANTYGKYE